MTRDQLIPVFTLMAKQGGGFASHLASAWFHADDDNQRRIQEAFPELIEDYKEMVPFAERQPAPKKAQYKRFR